MKSGPAITIGQKHSLAFSAITLFFILFGIFSQGTIREVKIRGPLYDQIISNKDLLADILPPPAYIIESYLCAMDIATAEDDPQTRKQLLTRLNELYEGSGYYGDRMDYWRQNMNDERIGRLFFGNALRYAKEFYDVALGDFSRAVRDNRMDAAKRLFYEKLKPAYTKHREAIDKVVELSAANFEKTEKTAAEKLAWRQETMLILFISLIVLFPLLGFFISRSITRPIAAGIRHLDTIAQGDLSQDLPEEMLRRGDEMGNLSRSMQSMTQNLRKIINKAPGRPDSTPQQLR